MAFADVHPHYIAKAEKKGRAKDEVHALVHWLTGYDEQTLQQQIDKKVDFETFFAQAPRINPNASKITGVICGYRVEEIEDQSFTLSLRKQSNSVRQNILVSPGSAAPGPKSI